jgi:hypothetical protein
MRRDQEELHACWDMEMGLSSFLYIHSFRHPTGCMVHVVIRVMESMYFRISYVMMYDWVMGSLILYALSCFSLHLYFTLFL